MALDSARALTFGTFAEEYALWRPTYPEDAVDWLLPHPAGARPAHVADVGAGTGQLTGALLARGLRVSAVEPDCGMLTVLTRLHAGAEPHLAAADALPFADASLDAVLVATAWHWFPVDDAVAEVRRVLRPGGHLGLVWNLVRPVADWEHELAGTDPDGKGTEAEAFAPPTSFPEDEVVTAYLPWDWHVSPEQYAGNLATNSAVMLLDEAERTERLERATAIVRRACERAGAPTVPVHHEAFCLRWTPA
jgi:SAM-dependent methyltransferase